MINEERQLANVVHSGCKDIRETDCVYSIQSEEEKAKESKIFLSKFHCELNFIEQCWGYAKRVYRQYPASSKDLERNILSALESVPLDSMRRFPTQACRFMNAYDKGLNGKQAAWTSKKYKGHRVLPDNVLHNLDV
ncbi:hypothetical protein BDR04DRAFT_898106 [Suillus decipiens]|nr:hypothetical protein BDR04DRAFT_898106 [Suillus decipiens]